MFKKIEGGPLKTKNFESVTVPKKIERGDPSVLSGFVSYVKKRKKCEGDPLH